MVSNRQQRTWYLPLLCNSKCLLKAYCMIHEQNSTVQQFSTQGRSQEIQYCNRTQSYLSIHPKHWQCFYFLSRKPPHHTEVGAPARTCYLIFLNNQLSTKDSTRLKPKQDEWFSCARSLSRRLAGCKLQKSCCPSAGNKSLTLSSFSRFFCLTPSRTAKYTRTRFFQPIRDLHANFIFFCLVAFPPTLT